MASKLSLLLFSIFIITFHIPKSVAIETDAENSDNCRRVKSDDYFIDFASYQQNIIVAEDNFSLFLKESSQNTGHLALIKHLESENVDLEEIQLENFPEGVSFHPSALYLVKPDQLYVLNYNANKMETRIEIFTIDSQFAKYHGSIYFDSSINGFFNDFLIESDHTLYITKYFINENLADSYPISINNYISLVNSNHLPNNVMQLYECTFFKHSYSDCQPMNFTLFNSVIGIVKDQFDNYYFSSKDDDGSYFLKKFTKDSTGNFIEKNKIKTKEIIGKIKYDEENSKLYLAVSPKIIHFFKNLPGGIVEIDPNSDNKKLSTLIKNPRSMIRKNSTILISSYYEAGGYACNV
ncbi:unnamed protein product [Blepharisma stoltei]|uniref:Uncharacterized protein n=1 Tax=Blepharisma stoltei TaxID=1481888 RepID=A0AAU9J654_9CILI|nr:unnamed protein product [Blepharisma stoltei]